jgi:hypothetical protein
MKKILFISVCFASLLTILWMVGCATEGGEPYHVSFTVDGDRNITWTKGDTDTSHDASAKDTGKGSIEIEAFPVEVNGVFNVHIDVDNGIALLIMGQQPGIYTDENIQVEFALDGVGYESATVSGTIEITSIGGVGEIVEGTFDIGFTSPTVIELTNGSFRVLLAK